jgi:hypothetical protein
MDLSQPFGTITLFALLSDYFISLPWTRHAMSSAGLAETQNALLIGLSLSSM